MNYLNNVVNKVEAKKCGFAVKKVLIHNETGELLIVQTTKNANVFNLQKKHNATIVKPIIIIETEEDVENTPMLIAAEKSDKATCRGISRMAEFVQLVKFGMPCRKAFSYSQM